MQTRASGIFITFVVTILLTASGSPNAEVFPGGGDIAGIHYVGVRDEPRHRHEFENDEVRIYDVLLPPQYITLYHAHTRDTIYVAVHGSRLKSQPVAGSSILPQTLQVPSGIMFWNDHASEPLIHEVTNIGESAARLVGVELKLAKGQFISQPLSGLGLKLRDTFTKVRTYKLSLAPGESTGELAINFSGVIIALTESTVSQVITGSMPRVSSFEPASWQWLDKPGKITLSNLGISSFEAVLYELP
jgi:hypothetical protein